MFCERFRVTLQEDLSNLSSMADIKQKDAKHNKHRFRYTAAAGSNLTKKNPNVVADYDKAPSNATQYKIDQIEKDYAKHVILNPSDLEYIEKTYGISFSNFNEPKNLGTKGITVFLDPQTNQYILTK
jgi:hypothetical protein